jgi:hypothetical protein
MVTRGAQIRTIEAEDALMTDGFHAYEADNDIRWTDGDAGVPHGLFESFAGGPLEITLHVGGATSYPDEGAILRAVKSHLPHDRPPGSCRPSPASQGGDLVPGAASGLGANHTLRGHGDLRSASVLKNGRAPLRSHVMAAHRIQPTVLPAGDSSIRWRPFG